MEKKNELFSPLLKRVEEISKSSSEKDEKLKAICTLLKENVPHYHWVGFYFADESKKRLTLGTFAGEDTEHVTIPFGRGICGQAAERKETFTVQDVSKETNYLSCSLKVRSEIVIPIFKGSRIVGQLDIDSHDLSPFGQEDRLFLEEVCAILSPLF